MLDEAAGTPLSHITLYLTRSDALELRDSLEAVLSGPIDRHEHVPSADNLKEITVCLYDMDRLEHFDERSRRLIREDQ